MLKSGEICVSVCGDGCNRTGGSYQLLWCADADSLTRS